MPTRATCRSETGAVCSDRRSRRRDSPPRPPPAPRRRHPDRGLKLPIATARRSHARAPALQGRHHAAVPGRAAETTRAATENQRSRSAGRLIETNQQPGKFYFGTNEESSTGIDSPTIILFPPFESGEQDNLCRADHIPVTTNPRENQSVRHSSP